MGKSNILPLLIASLAGFPQLVIKLLITFALRHCCDKLSCSAPWVEGAKTSLAMWEEVLMQVSCTVGHVAKQSVGTPTSTAHRGLAPELNLLQAQAVPW